MIIAETANIRLYAELPLWTQSVSQSGGGNRLS